MKGSNEPWGYSWRSSPRFIVFSLTMALFSETFLFGFVTPILNYMLEKRLHLDPSLTQRYTTEILTSHGIIGLVVTPIAGHLAEKSKSQKTPLLISLGGCLVGTLLIATTPSVWALFAGRIIQGVAGSATWVIGFSLLCNNVDRENVASAMGRATSFVTAGVVGGPATSGVLLQMFGYWTAWSLPLVILTLDIIARIIMIEPRAAVSAKVSNNDSKSCDILVDNQIDTPDESTALISDAQSTAKPELGETGLESDEKWTYFKALLSDPRVWVSGMNIFVTSILMSGMNNTLPVHVRDVFGWNSFMISTMFFCLQVPNIILGGPAGWLRGRLGVRGPTTLGWVAVIPLILLLGIPGEPHFPWAGRERAGKAIFATTLLTLGSVLPLVRGSGNVQLAYVVKDLAAQDPQALDQRKGNLRVNTITGISFNLGLMLGPLLAGTLVETVGYFSMTVAIAIICLIQAVASWCWYEPKAKPPSSEVEAS